VGFEDSEKWSENLGFLSDSDFEILLEPVTKSGYLSHCSDGGFYRNCGIDEVYGTGGKMTGSINPSGVSRVQVFVL